MIFVETSYFANMFWLNFKMVGYPNFGSILKTSILFSPSAYCRFARLPKIETAAGLRPICMCKNAKRGFGIMNMKRNTAGAQRHAKETCKSGVTTQKNGPFAGLRNF